MSGSTRAQALARALLDLFGGRRDIVARGYLSQTTGSGWSPACARLWEPSVCGLVGKRWGCADCTSLAPIAPTPAVVGMHITGEGALTSREPLDRPVWLGLYLVDPDGRAKCGVYDIDNHSGAGKPLLYLCRMRDALDDRGLLEHIAIFRSRRGRGPEGGFHVLISFAEPQPEAWVRAILTAIARSMELLPPPPPKLDGIHAQEDRDREMERWIGEHGERAANFNETFGLLEVEVFPKQASPDSPYGFLIALPCGGYWEKRTGGGIPIERDTLEETTRDYLTYLSEVTPLSTERFLALANDLGVDLTAPEVREPLAKATKRTRSSSASSPVNQLVTIRDSSGLEPLFTGCAVMRQWRDRQLAGQALSRNEWWPGAVLLSRTGSVGRQLVIELDRAVCGDRSRAEEQISGWRASGLPTCAGAFGCARNCFNDETASPIRYVLTRPVADQTHTPAPRPQVTTKEASRQLLEEASEFLDANPRDTVTVIASEAGAGKTTAFRDALRNRAIWNAPILDGRVRRSGHLLRRDHRAVVMVPTHALAEEWVLRGRNSDLDIERLPQLTKEVCVAGRFEDLEAAAEAGYDRRAAVCERCPHYPAARPEVRCPYYVELARVAKSGCDVLVAVRAYHRYGAFFTDFQNEDRPTVIYDEDCLPDVLHRVEATSGGLRAFVGLLDLAVKPDDDDPDYEPASESAQQLTRVLIRLSTGLADTLDGVTGTRALTLAELDGALPDAPDPALADDATVTNLAPRVARAWSALDRPTKNLLPLLVELLRARRDRTQPVALVSKTTIRCIVRHPLPGPQTAPPRRVALLDATASREVLERALSRPIDVRADFALEHDAKLVHYTGRTWSREALKTEEGKRLLGSAVTRLIERHRSARVGLITYESLLQQQPTSDGWEGSPQDAGLVRLLPPEIAKQIACVAHFGDLRGINALEDIGVLIVIGTPRPPADEIRLTALGLGATADEILEEGAVLITSYHGRTLRAWGWRGALMRLAHQYHVRSELMQAIGRLRHAWGEGKVLYVLSGEPCDLPGLAVRDLVADGLLEDDADVAAARRVALELLNAGGFTFAELEARLGKERRQARRLCAEVELWLGSRVRREGPRRGRLVWAPPAPAVRPVAAFAPPVAAPAAPTSTSVNLELFA